MHDQDQFLKEAGLDENQIMNLMREDKGLRPRRQRNTSFQQLQSFNQKPSKAFKIGPKQEPRDSPKTAKQFEKEYVKFASDKMISQLKQESISYKQLYELFKIVQDKNGYIQILSHGKLQEMVSQLQENNKFYQKKDKDLIAKYYMRFLIEYEFFLKGERLNINHEVNILNTLKPAIILKNQTVSTKQSASRGLQLYEEEIVMFEKGLDELGVDYSEIDLAKLQNYFGNQFIDIRVQNPMDYGFNVNKLVNKGGRMPIKTYTDYQKNYHDQEYKIHMHGSNLKNGRVFFGVNFEPSSLEVFDELWSKIDNTLFNFREDFDLLSYLDQDIPGCSSPQFYMKVKGCWTGGHQENIAMCAVNINHGPDSSEWYSIPVEEVEQVRTLLIERFRVDLYDSEGLWFEKINWFIENGFSIKRIVQKKGDIVISGPGTLHWVRSFGVAVQSAWNIFPKTYSQMKAAFHRYHENYKIAFDKNGIIPFKSLLVKWIEHEGSQIEEKTLKLIVSELKNWLKVEENYKQTLQGKNSIKKISSQEKPLRDLQSNCEFCKHQVLLYYIDCWSGVGIVCLQCFSKNQYFKERTLYCKYNVYHIKNLIYNSNNRSSVLGPKLCNGRHIGKVVCKRAMFEQDNKMEETNSMQNRQQTDSLPSQIAKESESQNRSFYSKYLRILQKEKPSDKALHLLEVIRCLQMKQNESKESLKKEQIVNNLRKITVDEETQTEREAQQDFQKSSKENTNKYSYHSGRDKHYNDYREKAVNNDRGSSKNASSNHGYHNERDQYYSNGKEKGYSDSKYHGQNYNSHSQKGYGRDSNQNYNRNTDQKGYSSRRDKSSYYHNEKYKEKHYGNSDENNQKNGGYYSKQKRSQDHHSHRDRHDRHQNQDRNREDKHQGTREKKAVANQVTESYDY